MTLVHSKAPSRAWSDPEGQNGGDPVTTENIVAQLRELRQAYEAEPGPLHTADVDLHDASFRVAEALSDDLDDEGWIVLAGATQEIGVSVLIERQETGEVDPPPARETLEEQVERVRALHPTIVSVACFLFGICQALGLDDEQTREVLGPEAFAFVDPAEPVVEMGGIEGLMSLVHDARGELSEIVLAVRQTYRQPPDPKPVEGVVKVVVPIGDQSGIADWCRALD